MVKNRLRKTDRIHDVVKIKQAIKEVTNTKKSLRQVATAFEINYETLRRYVIKASKNKETKNKEC